MSTIQYIGARYVPKFFEWNGSSEWRNGVAYEALTIVTRNGNSYTSKIPVPSDVGVPESNPKYWVASGLYNQQVESIRREIVNVDNKVDTLEGEIDSLETTVNKINNCEPINVLLLGIKNDGSEDCSALITEASADHALYFPYGVYRVDAPVYLKNSIYGAGGARLSGKGSVIKCNFTASHVTHIINVIEPYGENVGFEIKNICIDCNSVENIGGLNFAPNVALVGRPCLFVDDVSVWNVGLNASGINIEPSNYVSRCAYLDNISITGGSENCKGIILGQHASDCSLSNLEIMYASNGLRIESGSNRLNNCHIYCCRAGISNWDTYYPTTIGVDAYDKVIADNVYIDSAFQFWVQRAKCSEIGNMKLWLDNAPISVTRTDGTMLRSVDNGELRISNLIYGGSESTRKIYAVAVGERVFVGQIMMLEWTSIPLSQPGLLPMLTPNTIRQSYGFKSSKYSVNGTYINCAIVHVPNNGLCIFSVGRAALMTTVTVVRDGDSIRATSNSISSSYPLYYEISGNYMYIYGLQYGSFINVQCIYSSYGDFDDARNCVGLIDLTAMPDVAITYKTDTTGLTPISSS